MLHNLVLPTFRQSVNVINHIVVHMYGYYFFHNILYHLNVASLWLAACCLLLAASFNPEAWRLQLLAINKNLGTKALPGVTHDFELSCDGQQLAR